MKFTGEISVSQDQKFTAILIWKQNEKTNKDPQSQR